MKNIILTILLLITTNFFSQDKDKKSLLEEMNNYYNKNKIEKLEELTNDLLSGKYGSMDDELKFYALMYSSNVYSSDEYAKKDSQKGYDKVFELLVFAKSTSYAIPNKEAYIKSMSDYLKAYKNKYPEVKDSVKVHETKAVTEIKSEITNKTTETNTTEANTPPKKSTSDDKTVTLTVFGTGKTLEEAKTNALRSAIEQAFGAFISSKTEILNDNLVKDEIVSVSNGNIQKYDVISQVEVPNVGYAITLNTTLSITKLTSFAESKGVVVEFKGGMFGLKIKLQKLNEQAEIIAVKNIFETSFNILSNSFDYELDVSEPKLLKDDMYFLKFLISTKPNSNYDRFLDYFEKNIQKLSLTSTEILEYKNLNKKIYYIYINENVFGFRTMNAKTLFLNFLVASKIFTCSFKIFSNEGSVKFTYCEFFKDYDILKNLTGDFSNLEKKYNKSILLSASYPYCEKPKNGHEQSIEPLFAFYAEKNNLKRDELLSLLRFDAEGKIYKAGFVHGEKRLNIDTPIRFNSYFGYPKLQLVKVFKLSELEKINEFKIQKIEIEEFLKNRFLYMNPEVEIGLYNNIYKH